MSAAQKKAIDDHCTTDGRRQGRRALGHDFEDAGIEKIKAAAGHEVYKLTPEQLARWKKAAEPLAEDLGRRRQEEPAAIRTRR